MTRRARKLLWSLLLLLPATAVQADPQSKSFSDWQLRGEQVHATFTIAAREMTRFTPRTDTDHLASLWLAQLQDGVRLAAQGEEGEQTCAPGPLEVLASDGRYLRVVGQWHCPAGAALLLDIRVLVERVASHVHFANIRFSGGARSERLFTQSTPRQQVDPGANGTAQPDPSQSHARILATYGLFGFEHILIGLDHIAFLLTLMLLADRLKTLLLTITGFTLGHSITLALAALGMMEARADFIEALIGLTIALVAVENVVVQRGQQRQAARVFLLVLLALAALAACRHSTTPALAIPGLALFCFCYLNLSDSPARARTLRPAIAALFGLVHGFGFAGVLLEVGLPQQARLPALLGFNLGVELGQLAIVLVLISGYRMLRKLTPLSLPGATDAASAALCGVGVYWFIQRLYL